MQQRTMEQIADDVPMLTLLDSPVPQMVDQLVAVLARYDMPLADQVIEVPKVSCPARCGRTVLCTPQTAEQLVEVPTILSPSFLRMLQNVDTPVPGRGVQRGLQERSSTVFGGADHRFPAATAEQNVDIPVPGGSLHGLSVSGSSSSSAVSRDVRGDGVFRTFPQVKKKCDTTSALWVGTAPSIRAHGRQRHVTSLWCSRRSPRRSLTITLSTLCMMGVCGGPIGSGLAGRSAGGWLRQTDPRLAPQSGGRRGSSAEGQGDVLGTTVDTWSASVPGAYAVFFFFSTRRRTRILRSSVLLFGVFANHAERRSAHSWSLSCLPCFRTWNLDIWL